MTRRSPRWLSRRFLTLALALLLVPLTAVVAAEIDGQDVSPLGVRQQRVKRMMQDLNVKLQTLAQKLQETEPEQAKRLIDAFQQSNERLIEQRMQEIASLLDQAKLGAADNKQDEVLTELDLLLRVLLEQTRNWDKLKEEAERLDQMREQVRQLLAEQREHLRETDRLVNKDKTLADLDRQIRELEGLIERQEEVNDKTAKSTPRDTEGLEQLAKDQDAVRKDTDQLARNVAGQSASESGDGDAKAEAEAEAGKAADGKSADGKPGEGKPGEGKPGEGKPGEGKPGEGKPGEGKPGEGKPGEGKPGEGKPGEGKPGEGKPGEGKPGEGKPGEGKPGEGKPGEGKPGNQAGSSARAGKQSLSKAAQNQQSAAQKLAESLPKDAHKDEEKALEDLNKALDELRDQRDNIARLPQKLLDQLAEKQDATAEATKELAKQMQDSSDGKSGGGGQGGASGDQSPAQKNVQKAQQAMQQASGGLRKSDPDDAAREQEEAVKRLQEALDEIERRLAQLREETLLDRLACLETRFREMLVRQQEVTANTAAIQEHRDASGNLARADRLKLKTLATEERALAEAAYQTLDILVEDGTSVVFPHVVDNLREDLESTARLLDDQRTGDYTQGLQHEVERTLQELIDALQLNIKKMKKGGGAGGQCDCEPPLLPGSAELKLLRSMQLRVNRRTAQFAAASADAGLDAFLREQIKKTATIQEDVAKMALELAEKY